jgi:hypothetical protein
MIEFSSNAIWTSFLSSPDFIINWAPLEGFLARRPATMPVQDSDLEQVNTLNFCWPLHWTLTGSPGLDR